MTPDEITTIGQTLYGRQWKSPLARALCTSHKTVWMWATGRNGVSRRYQEKINALWGCPAGIEARARYALTQITSKRAVQTVLTSVYKPSPTLALLLKNQRRDEP